MEFPSFRFLWISAIFLAVFSSLVAASPKPNIFYIEDECPDSNETYIITYAIGSPESALNSSGILKQTRRRDYALGRNCTLQFQIPRDDGLVLSFYQVDLRDEKGICIDFIMIELDGGKRKTLCTIPIDKEEKTYFISRKSVIIHYYSDPEGTLWASYAGFQATLTSYKKGSCSSPSLFQCDNGLCISEKLICDGHNNCGDRSDEFRFGESNCAGISKGGIAGVVIGIIIFIAIIIILVLFLRKRSTFHIRL